MDTLGANRWGLSRGEVGGEVGGAMDKEKEVREKKETLFTSR